jgi:Protein of unknown function (DUF938)
MANVLAPLLLDVCAEVWLPTGPGATGVPSFDLIFCANMLHISPRETGTALMRGSAQHLAPGGMLVTYGPYFENAVTTAPSNLAFDDSLRQRNPAWGVLRARKGKIRYGLRPSLLSPLRNESIQETKVKGAAKTRTQYTYPQLLIQKSATHPGSILDRQGGSIFNRR